jgi:hypothetical protein
LNQICKGSSFCKHLMRGKLAHLIWLACIFGLRNRNRSWYCNQVSWGIENPLGILSKSWLCTFCNQFYTRIWQQWNRKAPQGITSVEGEIRRLLYLSCICHFAPKCRSWALTVFDDSTISM